MSNTSATCCEPFERSAKYYDLIHEDKDYDGEAQRYMLYIERRQLRLIHGAYAEGGKDGTLLGRDPRHSVLSIPHSHNRGVLNKQHQHHNVRLHELSLLSLSHYLQLQRFLRLLYRN